LFVIAGLDPAIHAAARSCSGQNKDPMPGSKVQIEQMPSIRQAAQKDQEIIRKEQPKYNERHK
jgi:hypothetical protein